MRFAFTILFLLLVPVTGNAFSCETTDIAERFEKADRVFLIKILETQLEEFPDLDVEEGELDSVRPLSVGYKVLEELKGDPDYRPRLLQLLNFTGIYANLLPGINYVIAVEYPDKAEIDDEQSEWASQFMFVSSCEVLVGYFAEHAEDVSDELDLIRGLANAEKKAD